MIEADPRIELADAPNEPRDDHDADPDPPAIVLCARVRSLGSTPSSAPVESARIRTPSSTSTNVESVRVQTPGSTTASAAHARAPGSKSANVDSARVQTPGSMPVGSARVRTPGATRSSAPVESVPPPGSVARATAKLPQASAWQPGLDGEDARIAGAVAREIAEALVDVELGDAPPMHGGHAGLAVMYRYLSKLDGGAWDRAAERHLARAIANAKSGPSLSLQFGGVGVAWLMHECRDLLGASDPWRAIDAAIRDHLHAAAEPLPFSLALGLAGIAVYALARDDHEMMALVARRLVDRAERSSGGARWHTLPQHMRPEARAELPDGHYNLGLMHGGPGAIAALAMLARALGSGGPAPATQPAFMPAAALVCRSTARVGLEWLLACRRGPRGGVRMLPSDDASPPPESFQASWCYSELGIACALHATGDSTLASAARSLGDFAIERCSRNVYGRDAGLCHGAAGVGHMMSRLAQHTGDPRAAKIARRSYRRAIARLHRRDRRIAVGDEGTWKSWDEHPGLIDGAAGVALALAAATTTVEPDWDRLLLLG